MFVCVCVCVRACVRACVRVCVFSAGAEHGSECAGVAVQTGSGHRLAMCPQKSTFDTVHFFIEIRSRAHSVGKKDLSGFTFGTFTGRF